MKKLFISALSMLAVAMGFTACTSDDDPASTPDTPKQITVYATTEQPSATRTSLSEGNATDGYEVLWSEGDQIKFGVSDDYVFTLKSGAGTTTGVFEGTAPKDGNSYMVVYPTNFNGKVPTEQTYVENNIPQGLPMMASKVSVQHVGDEVVISPISFKNVGGILRLNLKGEAKVTSITISATNLTNPITLSCGTGVQLNTTTATPFHIAVSGTDAGTIYSGLKIEITDDAGKVCTKTAKVSITVQRSMITDITLTASNFFPFGQGEAAATGIGNVKWIQLWAGGPKFAEYNVGASSAADVGSTMTYIDATKAGEDYVWGDNWCTPSKADMEHLMTAAKGQTDEKVKCEYTQEGSTYGFKFTGLTDGYTDNSVFFPAQNGSSDYGNAFYWSGTANDSEAWLMGLRRSILGGWYCYWYSYSQDDDHFVRPVLKN